MIIATHNCTIPYIILVNIINVCYCKIVSLQSRKQVDDISATEMTNIRSFYQYQCKIYSIIDSLTTLFLVNMYLTVANFEVHDINDFVNNNTEMF